MALRLKGSYGLALLFTTGIVGWMATGHAVVSGQENELAAEPPAVRNKQIEAEAVRVAVNHSKAQMRDSVLTIRGRTESDSKVTVRAETTAIVRNRPVKKGQWVKAGELLCELDEGSRAAALAQAEAALAQAEFDLNAKQTLAKKGFAAKTEIAALTAQRDAALASVKQARIELERIRITAAFDGVIQGPLAEVGDQLTVGSGCAVLMNPDPMLVVGQVSEREIRQVRVGAMAQVTLVTGEAIQGKVRYVSTASDIETRTFLVEVEVPNPDRALRDGVTALAQLSLAPTKAHLMSPAHLTLSDEGLIGVMLVSDGVARFTPAQIIGDDAGGIWLAGLPEEIDVITVGQEYVKDGGKVKAVAESELTKSASREEASLKGEAKQ